MRRLEQWVGDVNALQSDAVYNFVFVDEDGFTAYRPSSFSQILEGFTQYKAIQA
jgi:type III restriction enzyme